MIVIIIPPSWWMSSCRPFGQTWLQVYNKEWFLWYHYEWYYNCVWTIKTWHIHNIHPVSVIYTLSKCPKINNVSESYLWYCRLGHVNKNRIDRLTKECVLEIDNCESLPTCESYLLGKMTKSPFKEKGERASNVLGLIHTDVCGPINISVRGVYYYIMFTDDLSRYGYVYFMKHWK